MRKPFCDEDNISFTFNKSLLAMLLKEYMAPFLQLFTIVVYIVIGCSIRPFMWLWKWAKVKEYQFAYLSLETK